jgi:transcription antitermination factor NusG
MEGTLAKALRNDLGVPGEFPVFVPCSPPSKNIKNVSVLMEGYAFVSSGLPETKYFSLESKALVQKVLSSKGHHGLRILHTIPNHQVVEMQRQLRTLITNDVEEGMVVRITGGCYAKMEGTVVDVFEYKAAVRIPLRSIDIITLVPKSLLNLHPDSDDEGGDSFPLDSCEELSVLGEE